MPGCDLSRGQLASCSASAPVATGLCQNSAVAGCLRRLVCPVGIGDKEIPMTRRLILAAFAALALLAAAAPAASGTAIPPGNSPAAAAAQTGEYCPFC